jgi:site-specific DNA-methyltransferase (adenine-specific)
VGDTLKAYYEHLGIAIYHGDCREILPTLELGDVVIADPPYQQTSLSWDRWQYGWPAHIKTGSLWCFGTMRMFMQYGAEITAEGFQMSQDLVWQKHNGSSFHADRFRRVHESILHFYRGSWESVYKNVPTTPTANKKQVRRKQRPAHMGHIDGGSFVSEDGGPQLMESVIFAHSCHGYAVNETQKPLAIIRPLLEYSCPPGGLVIDPFSGSGTTLVAAKEMGLQAIGIEARESQCEEAAKRLSQEVLNFSD